MKAIRGADSYIFLARSLKTHTPPEGPLYIRRAGQLIEFYNVLVSLRGHYWPQAKYFECYEYSSNVQVCHCSSVKHYFKSTMGCSCQLRMRLSNMLVGSALLLKGHPRAVAGEIWCMLAKANDINLSQLIRSWQIRQVEWTTDWRWDESRSPSDRFYFAIVSLHLHLSMCSGEQIEWLKG